MFPKSLPRSSQNHNQTTDGCNSPVVSFSWVRMTAQNDSDSESVTPRLWHSGSSAFVPNSSYHHPMSLHAHEIERGRQELMQLCEGMPESAYDLSFKDLVNHEAAMEQMNSDDSPISKKTNNSLKKKRAPVQHIRRRYNGPKNILLNMFVPSSLMVGSYSPYPSQVVSQRNDRSSGISSKEVVRKERPNNYLLSLLRIRPSKSEISLSNTASKVSLRPYLGKDDQPDLPFMGSPNGSKSNSSNQCAMCSAYTVLFKTQCQACKKIYCSNCAKLAIANTQKGPRCQATCAFGPNSERDLESKMNSCWHILSTNKIKSGRKINSKNSCSKKINKGNMFDTFKSF